MWGKIVVEKSERQQIVLLIHRPVCVSVIVYLVGGVCLSVCACVCVGELGMMGFGKRNPTSCLDDW